MSKESITKEELSHDKSEDKAARKRAAGEARKKAAGEAARGKAAGEAARKRAFGAGRKMGYDEAERELRPSILAEGRIAGKREIVIMLETKMMEVAGYHNREEWAKSATIPAYWIATLIACYEVPPQIKSRQKKKTPEGLDDEED